MYASVCGGCGGCDGVVYVVTDCLKEGLAALAVTAGVTRLRASYAAALVGLLRLHDHLLQAVALLVGAAVLHLRHCLLNVSEPSVRHFVLTTRNKTRTSQRSRTEIPLTSIRIDVVHDLEPRKGLVRCDNRDMRMGKGTKLLRFTRVSSLLVR
jgi:hypothetical protein